MKHRPSSHAEARRLRDDAALRRAARRMSRRPIGKHRPEYVAARPLTTTETAASVVAALAWMEGR